MSEKNIKSNFYNWSIEKGDYIRDYECTSTYEKRKRRSIIKSKTLKVLGAAGLFLFVLAVIIDLLSKT